jgi:hypothetical protein
VVHETNISGWRIGAWLSARWHRSSSLALADRHDLPCTSTSENNTRDTRSYKQVTSAPHF